MEIEIMRFLRRGFGRKGLAVRLSAAAMAAVLAASPMAAHATGLAGSYLAARHAANNADIQAAADYFSRSLRHDPGNPVLTEQAMIYRVAADDISGAVVLAGELIDEDKEHRLANLVMVVHEMQSGELAAAQARIKQAGEGFNPLIAGLLSAWAAMGQGDREGVEAALEELETRPVFRLFSRYHAGLILSALGDGEAAEKAFTEAIDEAGGANPRLASAYGRFLERTGRRDEARALYSEALDFSGSGGGFRDALKRVETGGEAPELLVDNASEGAAEALFGLGGALAQDNGQRFALLYVRLAAHLKPDFPDASILMGELLEDQGQYVLAAEAYGEVPEGGALHVSAVIGRASALREQGEEDGAVETLRGLVADNPDLRQAKSALADLLRRLERYDEAAVAYSSVIKDITEPAQPDWPVFYARGICYERTGEWDLAELDLKKALELQPDQPLVLNYLGYSWVDQGIHIEEAREMIEKAVELRPEDGYITDSLGWALYRMGDFDGAVKYLEQAVELQPVDPIITDHFADALWQVGRRMEARFQWRRSLSFEPEEKEEIRIRRKLEIGLDEVLAEEEAEGAAKKAETEEDKPNGG